MDNQHRMIKGYRELNATEIGRMNEIKTLGAKLGELIEALEIEGSASADTRWVAIAKTNLQQGLMALTRAVAKPEFF
jgi:hypothetical protein